MNRRVTRLRERMAESRLHAVLISNASNRRYLSGFSGSAGWLLITPDEALIATDSRYYEQATRQAPDFRLHRALEETAEWMPGLLADLAGKRVGLEAGDVSYATYRTLRRAGQSLPQGERPRLVPTQNLVGAIRVIKEPEEIKAIQAAVDLGDAAFSEVARRIEPGWTEKQAAWEIEKHIREHGGEGVAFGTIVAAGPWGAMPHAYPRDQAIEKGESVVIDVGVRLDGYTSDLSRTIVLGKPDERFRQVYDIVLTAQLAAEELIEPGMSGEQAHLLGQRVIEEAGYGEHFGHGLGHGVGLEVHEAPRLRKMSKDVLAEGMVFTIEPGVYVSGWGGVRIEDLVVLEKGRVRVLSAAPKLLNECGP